MTGAATPSKHMKVTVAAHPMAPQTVGPKLKEHLPRGKR
jgi:hypothetical protein